ncbi:MAG: cupin domain-containing protein [Chloroflexota bacterium]|nr:cupin domain-containing protein [Chloroflexota bacterium]
MAEKNPDTEGLAERTLKLAELIEYQESSVVSRTIIDRKTGTLTLFAFAEGQGLSEHTAPFDALVHLLDGETIIMPANKPHALKAIKDFKMLLVMIRS